MTFEHAGEEYTVSPLGLRELEYLENFARGQVIAAGRESIPEDAKPKERDEMMAPIIAEAMKVNIMDSEGFKRMQTPAGVVRLFYVALKQKSPNITLEVCRAILKSHEAREEIKAAIGTLNPNPKEIPEPKNPPAPLVEGAQSETLESIST
jgi:hypothetical protein